MNKNLLIISLTALISFFSIVACFRLWRSNYNLEQKPSAEHILQKITPTITPTPPPQKINIIFTGDAMFDRHIRTNARKTGYDSILENLTEVLNQSDIVLANLEGPITNFPSRSENSEVGSTDNYFFTFDPQITSTLRKNNIYLVNLGNNHILNFGQEGIKQTLSYLDAANIDYFGNTGTNLVSDYIIKNFGNLNIALINHNQFVTGGKGKTLKALTNLPIKPDLIIIYAHWGNEYETNANTTIQNIAYQFIDEGADLVIGSHHHVVQQSEIYKGKTIYYSLGNFVFDQYFEPNVQNSILLKVNIDPENLNMLFEEVPIKMTKDGKTSLMYNELL